MASTPFTEASQGVVLAAGIFPTEAVQASQATALAATDHQGGDIEASQAVVLVAARGRVANPRVRAWTFTLDGHDFYVLRLGDEETLIYDLYSEQWVNWSSAELPFWRTTTGITWIGGSILGFTYGSSIVCGDDTQGLLWLLDPELAYDESSRADSSIQQIAFNRVVTGQVPMTGREVMPCYAIFLIGDNYGLVADDFTPFVRLDYSDDQGKTYDEADTITVTTETVDQDYTWLSLGQIEAPGRLFRIVDNGIFARIDSMTMNDEDSDDDG